MTNRIQNFNQFNEGRAFRGLVKGAFTTTQLVKMFIEAIKLNWEGIKKAFQTIPHGYKLINALDTIKSPNGFLMSDKLKVYKDKWGSDMLEDMRSAKEYIRDNVKNSKKLVDSLELSIQAVEKSLNDDLELADTLQDLKNKMTELSNWAKERGQPTIDYPSDWFEKPIFKMSEVELREEMDRALDNNDMLKARYIGQHLQKYYDN
jgi:hypothetical protein